MTLATFEEFTRKRARDRKFQDSHRVKLDELIQDHLHPDTSAPFTKDDLERMPWLGGAVKGEEGGVDKGDQNDQQDTPAVNQQEGQKGQQDVGPPYNSEECKTVWERASRIVRRASKDGQVSQEMRGQIVREVGQQDHQKRRHDWLALQCFYIRVPHALL